VRPYNSYRAVAALLHRFHFRSGSGYGGELSVYPVCEFRRGAGLRAAADLTKNPLRYLESERPEGADFLHEVLPKNLLESGALTA
jgi:hypothetical protein